MMDDAETSATIPSGKLIEPLIRVAPIELGILGTSSYANPACIQLSET